MMRIVLIISLSFGIANTFSQELSYFKKKRDYIYNALYIDSIGDTITNETLTLRVLDRRWLAQPWLQWSVRYIFVTDTVGYKNYLDPDSYFRERNARKYAKKGEYPLAKKSTTGGYQNEGFFYMHPPRTNQYRMLFYSAHPKFYFPDLEKDYDTLASSLRIYGMGYLDQQYRFQKLGRKELFGDSIPVYQVNVHSYPVTEKKYLKERLEF